MDSFILYTSQYPAIESLSKTAKGELLDALYLYALEGKVPTFSQAQTEMAFNFIRIRIDENNSKYLTMCEKRRLAGRKGGRPSKKKAEAEKEKQKVSEKANKPNAFLKSKAKQKKLTDTDTESSSISKNTDTASDTLYSKVADTATLQKKQKTKKTREGVSETQNDSDYAADRKNIKDWEKWYKQILRLFNEAVRTYESTIRPVRTLSDSRRKALRLLATKYRYSWDDYKQAFRNMAISAYCNGRTERRKGAVDFDWLIKEPNFIRAFEGSL